MEELIRQIQRTHKFLQKPPQKTSWEMCSTSMKELATAVESLHGLDNYKEVVRHLLCLSKGIGVQIASIRSMLVRDICESLLRIVIVTGRDFQEMANALLPQIISTARNTSVAIRQPGAKLLNKMSKLVRYDLAVMRKVYMELHHARLRTLVLEQLRLIFVFWEEEEILPWESDVIEIIRHGVKDQDENVRKVAREVLCRFSSKWSGNVEELAELLSDKEKILIVQEHRTSCLAGTITENYPQLIAKHGSTLISQVKKSVYKPSRLKREQSVQKQVSASSPRGLLEENQSRGDVTANSKTALTSKMTESKATVSHFLSDSDGTCESEQTENANKIANDSQLQEFRTRTFMQSVDPDSRKPARLLTDVKSLSTVTRAAITSDVAVTSALGTLIRKSSEIQISTNLNPSFFSKKQPDSFSNLSYSPESSMLDLKETNRSTLDCDLQGEEETDESKGLRACDNYYSETMPSSHAPTAFDSSSSKNVTFRDKFRRQEDDDTSLHTYVTEPPFFELSPKMSTLSEPVIPVPHFAFQADQETVYQQHDQYGQYASVAEHDKSDPAVECDSVESDEKISLASNTNNGSVELNEGLDECPDDENWLDFADKIGDSMDNDLMSGVDNSQRAAVIEEAVLETEWPAGSLPYLTRSETEEKDGRDGDSNPDNLTKEAFAGLVDLCDEVQRLRPETGDDEERNLSQNKLESVLTQEMQEVTEMNCDSLRLEKTEEPSHGCSRMFEYDHEQLDESSDVGQRSLEHDANETASRYANESVSESNAPGFNDFPGPSYGLETSTRNDEGKPSHSSESMQPWNDKKAQSHRPALFVDEEAGRFHAAEKLFATGKAPMIHGGYNRPPSPQPEDFTFQRRHFKRNPPTQLGAQLHPSRKTEVGVEEKVAPVEAETQATVERDENVVTPSFNEPMETQEPVDNKPSTSSLTSDSTHHSLSTPPPMVSERTGRVRSFVIAIILILAGSFCAAGVLRAAKVAHDSHAYHMALQSRIERFEASIMESHEKVRMLEKEYAVWSDYVRKLTEEEEAHAMAQLEAIQAQVQQWQQDMRADLLAFRQAFSVDALDASFEKLRVNATQQLKQ
ncbi:hypothetical protein PsorP6_006665 [Peronosclerospora sorghi]|uniref:Uncharacterized protein n=1 Tax=Peronosclerospora sorghi TaxID=230839 RepID=A0ACC0W7B3_9STRA|nr:hypothetical protein PsorP6_006665 [Peronosclerospora sorghi]